jgi:two-component SAPR family response regulator
MKKHTERKGKRLKVTGIQYAPAPDAKSRLSRAIDILLRSAATELEGSVSAKKEEEPPKDSRPEKIAGQSDGEKG